MKWVTREKARVDRIACPWLISRFIDKEADVSCSFPANQGPPKSPSARGRDSVRYSGR